MTHATNLFLDIFGRLWMEDTPISIHWCLAWALSISALVGALRTCCVRLPAAKRTVPSRLMSTCVQVLSCLALSQSPRNKATSPGDSAVLSRGMATARTMILMRVTTEAEIVAMARPHRHSWKYLRNIRANCKVKQVDVSLRARTRTKADLEDRAAFIEFPRLPCPTNTKTTIIYCEFNVLRNVVLAGGSDNE